MNKRVAFGVAGLVLLAAIAYGLLALARKDPAAGKSAIPEAVVRTLATEPAEILAGYRKLIVLFADEAKMSPAEAAAATQVGQQLFHANREREERLESAVAAIVSSGAADRLDVLSGFVNYVEADAGLFDADRLAFKEAMRATQRAVAADGSLPAIRFHKRLSEDVDALAEIERNYEKEIRQVFGRFETRAIELKRERWEAYIAKLRSSYSREQILKDYGVILGSNAAGTAGVGEGPKPPEFDGKKFPSKTVLLTFDDGPHQTYTSDIAAILKQYNAPAVFFEVGRNLGEVGADGKPKLSARAAAARELAGAGFTLANHSFTHSQLSKQTGEQVHDEIASTDLLLKSVDAKRAPLFRFPYGARSPIAAQTVMEAKLTSVMWNVDSLDWADPVPSSIVERVMRSLQKEGRGVLLFHDIHERTVKALPLILDRLAAEGYRFAEWNGSEFVVAKGGGALSAQPVPVAGYAESYAIVVGIDDYAKWPKLQYAQRDAEAVREVLIRRFGFAADHVYSLRNQDATRAGILAAFHDKLAHANLQKNDRVFFFFAGHGATRKLSSGRDLGYIVPYDSDPNQIAADAIPMTEIQDIAESLPAKHVMFVMDACYSGLGLTRGGSNGNFLRDNAKRVGRQMLTAGGADQLVADGGPNGHSVFTWALLQGLEGKADLNQDGVITATELAAYVAPAVANASAQTPAFGSLPGSEGGDFVFELPANTEFLSENSAQLSKEAIALNNKLDSPVPAVAPDAKAKTAQVAVKDLEGRDVKITVAAAAPAGAKQNAQRLNDRGLQLYKERKYAEAEAQFTEALKLRSNFALAANNLGFVYYKTTRYAEAARWFENALKMDPSRAIAYVNLGDAYQKLGDKTKADQAYSTYLEITPSGSSAAYVREQMGR